MLKYGFCCGLLGVSEYIAPSSFLVYIFDLSKYWGIKSILIIGIAQVRLCANRPTSNELQKEGNFSSLPVLALPH